MSKIEAKLVNVFIGRNVVSDVAAVKAFLESGGREPVFWIDEKPMWPCDVVKAVESRLSTAAEIGAPLVVCTHSPYVLTAINLFALAGRCAAEKPYKASEVSEIVDSQVVIPQDQLSGWLVRQGSIASVIDIETGLLDCKELDRASDDIEEMFDEILSTLYPASLNRACRQV